MDGGVAKEKGKMKNEKKCSVSSVQKIRARHFLLNTENLTLETFLPTSDFFRHSDFVIRHFSPR